MSTTENDSWELYSKLVLKELETLTIGIKSLNDEMHSLKREIILLKEREDKVEEIKSWKDKIADVITPAQLDSLVKEVNSLRDFKVKAITIFIVVQAIFAGAVAVLQIFHK